MKRLLSFILITMSVGMASAQSYSDAFDEAFAHGNIAAQRMALQLWQQEAPDDVNLYIALYNYYANQAMAQQQDPTLADSALMAIAQGLELFPQRLDIWFGKIFFLGEVNRWDAFADEIVRMLDSMSKADQKWVFPNVQDGIEELVCEAIDDYQNTMLGTVSDLYAPTSADSAMLRRVRRVARRTVQVFPSDVSAVYMLAVSYLHEDLERAIKYLQRAATLAPDNTAVQSLIEVVRNMLIR